MRLRMELLLWASEQAPLLHPTAFPGFPHLPLLTPQ